MYSQYVKRELLDMLYLTHTNRCAKVCCVAFHACSEMNTHQPVGTPVQLLANSNIKSANQMAVTSVHLGIKTIELKFLDNGKASNSYSSQCKSTKINLYIVLMMSSVLHVLPDMTPPNCNAGELCSYST